MHIAQYAAIFAVPIAALVVPGSLNATYSNTTTTTTVLTSSVVSTLTTISPPGTSATGAGGSGSSSGSAGAGSQGGQQSGSSTTADSSIPTAVLQPAVHWDTDTSAISQLQPSTSNTVFYSSNQVVSPYVAQQIANLGIAFNYPAVVLDHSSRADASYVDLNTVSVAFTDPAAYLYASQNWVAASPTSPIIFLGYLPGSPSSADGDRHYSLATSVTCTATSGTCIVTGSDVGFEGAANNFTVEWGQYTPDPSKTASMVMPPTTSSGSSASLPQCQFGDSFDQCLDNQIGYINFAGQDFTNAFDSFTGVSPSEGDVDQDDFDFAKRGLEKRRCYILCSVRAKIANVVQSVRQAVKAVVAVVVKVAQAVPILKDIVNHEVSQSLNKEIKIQVPSLDSARVTSPWSQNSISLYSSKESDTKKIDVWCVDCGVTGSIAIQGKIAASIASILTTGPSQAYVGVNGNLLAGLYIGIQARIELKKEFDEKPIFRSGLPGLTIPNVVSVGPFLTVGAKLSLGVEANGQLIAGGNISFPDFAARVDLVTPSSSFQKGFVPIIGKRFEAEGSVSATADLGFPIGIALGVDVLNGKYTKSVALVEQPGVQFHAKAAISASLANGVQSNNGDCAGISYGFAFTNNVFYKIGDSATKLFSNTLPIADACLVLPFASQPTTTASSSISASSSSETSTGTESSSTESTSSASSDSTLSSTSASATDSTDTATGTSVSATTTSASEPPSTTASAPSEPTDMSSSSTLDSTSVSETASATTDSSSTETPAVLGKRQGSNSTDYLTLPDDDDSTELQNYTIPDALNDDVPDTTDDQTDGTQTAILIDFQSQYKVISSDDSNLYLQYYSDTSPDDTTAYAFKIDGGDTVVGLESGEAIFYYTDEIAALGVSRFRTGFSTETPKTAKLAFLNGVNYDDSSSTPDALIAYDLDGAALYPIVCGVENKGTQIFLGTDVDQAIATLKSTAVQHSITGGVVDDCYFVGLQISIINEATV